MCCLFGMIDYGHTFAGKQKARMIRALAHKGKPYDILCGTFFICGAPPDSDHFDSLTDKQVKKFEALFHQPEMFLKMGGQIIVLPAPLE